MANYYLDTYALIAISNGSFNYKKYSNCTFVTHLINLYEMYHILLRTNGKETATKLYLKFKQYEISGLDEDIFNAAEFKQIHKNKRISYADALGYAIAKRLNCKFLTGDQGFEGLENVEYTKQ